jgi:hypothetical protein
MKEPSTPQVYYDGSLKELATRHVGLVKAVLFTLIIAAPISAYIIAFFENSKIYEYTVQRQCGYGFAYLLVAYAVLNLLFRFYRLAALLYPHVCLYFTLLLFVPFLNLLVILLLWWAGLRQMRGRGLRVGFFGIDPARVE